MHVLVLKVTLLLAYATLASSQASHGDAAAHSAGQDHRTATHGAHAAGHGERVSGKEAAFDDYALYTDAYDATSESYFNPQTGFLDDVYGDYFFEDQTGHSFCHIANPGTEGKQSLVLIGAYAKMCDIKVQGADAHVRALPGGLDGVYKVTTCEGARPAFLRQESPPGQDRMMWYSKEHKGWDVSNGSVPNPKDILMYGGENKDHLRPEFVGKDEWFLASEFQADDSGEGDYMKAEVELICDNQDKAMPKPEPETINQPKPYLTQEEMANQYRAVIEPVINAPRLKGESDDSFITSRGLVFMLMVVGVVLLCVIPRYLTARERRKRHGDGPSWIGLTPMRSTKQASA